MPLNFISSDPSMYKPLMNFNENREFHLVHDLDFFLFLDPLAH